MSVRVENRWRCFARESWERDGLEVFMLQDFSDTRVRVLQPDGSTREVSLGCTTDGLQPTFFLNRSQAEALVETLVAKGFRPAGRRFEQEQDLLRAHLADMRALVFKKSPGGAS